MRRRSSSTPWSFWLARRPIPHQQTALRQVPSSPSLFLFRLKAIKDMELLAGETPYPAPADGSSLGEAATYRSVSTCRLAVPKQTLPWSCWPARRPALADGSSPHHPSQSPLVQKISTSQQVMLGLVSTAPSGPASLTAGISDVCWCSLGEKVSFFYGRVRWLRPCCLPWGAGKQYLCRRTC